MVKGSKARHCHVCRRIVSWAVPTGKSYLGIREMRMNTLPCYGGNDGKGYICLDCKAEQAKKGENK